MHNNIYNNIIRGLLKHMGLLLAALFYLVSILAAHFNSSGDKSEILENVQTITIAHWQLEDGFREGMDAAIKQYEELKASQGQKVKIIQSTVPWRGYQQWYTTQLISGEPADIIELLGSSQIMNQYFIPLSSHVSVPNPYNENTPLAGIPWKDTCVDGMNSALDSTYAEYFGIGTFFHVTRVFVNKDLLRKATGSDKLPVTLDEWLDDCQALRKYGRQTGEPIIPIGVRGFDKMTLSVIFGKYYSQLSGNLPDLFSTFCLPGIGTDEQLSCLAVGDNDWDRLLAAVDLTVELGGNFCEGFTATDLEQTKFLFFSGNVGFFPEGTWNAWSIVNNSPFEVAVISIPAIGPENRYYKYFTGKTSELSVSLGGRFGITKSSRHKELALDFLKFLTSYKINQMTMMEYCKWPPAVAKAEYKGLLKKFRPESVNARLPVTPPFLLSSKSTTKVMEILEDLIVNNSTGPGDEFRKKVTDILPFFIAENREKQTNYARNFLEIESQRSCFGVGLLANTGSQSEKEKLIKRQCMTMENMVTQSRNRYVASLGLDALEKLQKENK